MTRSRPRLRAFLQRRALNLTLGFFILLPSLFLFGYFFPPINHDTAAILAFSRRWLGGERLYVDLIDINTPMVFLIHTLPVLLAQATGLSVPAALTLFFALCIGLSLYVCHRLLADHVAPERPLTRWLALLVLFYSFIVFPGENFGQREHLMMLAAYPYLLLAAVRATPGAVPLALRLSIAVAAAFALGQKPHFLPILVLIELYVMARVGWRRAFADPVPWTVFLILVAYLAWTFMALPAFYERILPIAFGEYAKLGEGSPLEVLMDRYMGPTALILLPLTFLAFVATDSHLKRLVALFAIGAALSNILQAKGWPYHVMPVQTATFLLVSLFLAGAIDRIVRDRREVTRLAMAAVIGASMSVLYYTSFMLEPPFRKQLEFSESQTAQLLRIVKRHARNNGMLVFSPGIYPFFPLVLYARAQMVMPYQTMWLLQGLYGNCEEGAPLYREPEEMPEIERRFFDEMGRVLAERRPEVIIVDRVPGIPRCHEAVFDYLEYFLRNPTFAEAFKEYEYVTAWDRYVVYRRI